MENNESRVSLSPDFSSP